MIAYRMGYSPDIEQEPHRVKQMPTARISVSEAERLMLPCGVRFGQASPEQLTAWFRSLVSASQLRQNHLCLSELLAGLDLTKKHDRWYALCELLERAKVRAVFYGGAQPQESEVA